MKKMTFTVKTLFFILLSLFISGVSLAADKAGTPVKIAIFPFSMNTPGELGYLREGIRDMLSSRLAWQGKVQVIDRTATDQALQGKKGDLSAAEAIRIGTGLDADYVLFGSVTALGRSISIDAKMADASGKAEPIPIYFQANSLDEVIPRINQSAQEINRKVFARSTEQTQSASADAELASVRNPELLVPGAMMDSSDKISYLNPNFIEITPESSLRQAGLWRSQTFSEGIVGMDIGDLDGDGRPELVTVSESKLTVFQREANGLKTIGTFNGTKMDRFIWVSVADLDRDGKSEIHVTNLRRINDTSASTTEKVGYGKDTLWELSSFGLRFAAGKPQVFYKNAPYFLNALEIPQRGKILLGQQKGDDRVSTLRGDVQEMTLRGQTLVPLMPIPLPSQCNIFNFAMADINNDHINEIILIDQDNRLIVLTPSGEQLWKSRQRFAATSNGFTGKVTDLRFNLVDYFYIPSPILVTDLNKDKITEVVANRSPDYDRFLPEGLKYYNQGEIVSLSYDQMGLVENWKTRDISGMVTAIRVADLNGDGTPELVASVVMAKDFMKLWESRSTIFSYDLNIDTQKTAAAKSE